MAVIPYGRSHRASVGGTLLLPSAEGQRLIDQARTAADALGMPGPAKRATAAGT